MDSLRSPPYLACTATSTINFSPLAIATSLVTGWLASAGVYRGVLDASDMLDIISAGAVIFFSATFSMWRRPISARSSGLCGEFVGRPASAKSLAVVAS